MTDHVDKFAVICTKSRFKETFFYPQNAVFESADGPYHWVIDFGSTEVWWISSDADAEQFAGITFSGVFAPFRPDTQNFLYRTLRQQVRSTHKTAVSQPFNVTEFSEANAARAAVWHEGTDPWSTLEWAGSMCGEAGEAANIAKKIKRVSQGIERKERDIEALKDHCVEELADTVIYAQLVAHDIGRDLWQAITDKFNKVSREQDIPIYIGDRPDDA